VEHQRELAFVIHYKKLLRNAISMSVFLTCVKRKFLTEIIMKAGAGKWIKECAKDMRFHTVEYTSSK